MENQAALERNVNLKDYVNVIIKQRKVIALIFIFVMILGAAATLMLPKTYSVYMVIEPPINGLTETGASYLDSTANMKTMIEMSAFNKKITEAIGKDFTQKNFSFDVRGESGSFLKVSIEETANEINSGIAILRQLFERLSEMYREVINYRKVDLQKKIDIIDNDITAKLNAITAKQEEIKIFDDREKELMEEIVTAKNNTEKLVTDRSALLEKKQNIDGMSSLLYSNTIQQNIYYFGQLTNDLSKVRLAKENSLAEIKLLENRVNEQKLNKERTILSKENIRNVRLIQEPVVSSAPPKPNKKIIIVMVFLVSMALSIFVAFFLEYWKNIKKQ